MSRPVYMFFQSVQDFQRSTGAHRPLSWDRFTYDQGQLMIHQHGRIALGPADKSVLKDILSKAHSDKQMAPGKSFVSFYSPPAVI